jgi:hypothetical protein
LRGALATKQSSKAEEGLDCRVASLLAMTGMGWSINKNLVS